MTRTAPPYSQFLAPRYWPTWVGIGLLSFAAMTPLRTRLWLGARLGDLTFLLAHERRYITRVNIRLCFPELSHSEQEALVRDSFRENGIGLVETACGWIRPAAHFKPLSRLKGGDLIAAALAEGRGVLFLGAHYTTLDFAANLLSQYFPFAVTYRSHKNPLFDAFMLRGRLRNCDGVFDRHDIRGAFRHLRQGKILWYAPDQDYGPDQSVFAPFFGNNAATITAGARFASFNKSPTFIVRHHRVNEAQPYVLEAIPFPDFPGDDDLADAKRMNLALEAGIRVNPAQYLWMHKRFKTQPGGKPESPYIFIKTPNRKLSAARYGELTAGAVVQSEQPTRHVLASALELRHFTGLAQGWRARSHAALQLDSRSKTLRSRGLAAVTVDSLFRVPHLDATFATCFVPKAVDRVVSPDEAAAFLAEAHRLGVSFLSLRPQDLIVTESGLAIDDPLRVRIGSQAPRELDRQVDLHQLKSALQFDAAEFEGLVDHYLLLAAEVNTRDWRAQLAAMERAADNDAPPAKEPPTA